MGSGLHGYMPLSWLWVRKGHGSKTTTEHSTCSAGPSAQGRLQLIRVCVLLPNAVDETAQSTIHFGQYPELSETGACFVLLHTWVGRLYFSLVPNIS